MAEGRFGSILSIPSPGSTDDFDPISGTEVAQLQNARRALDKQKADLAQKMRDNKIAGLEKIGALLEKSHKVSPKMQPMVMEIIKRHLAIDNIQADPEALKSLMADPDAASKFVTAYRKMMNAPAGSPERDAAEEEWAAALESLKSAEGFVDSFLGERGEGEDKATKFEQADMAMKIDQKFNAKQGVQNAKLVDTTFKSMLGIHNDIRNTGRTLDKSNKIDSGNIQTLIVGFNKLIDPTSVVRESEFARTAGYGTIVQRIKNFIGGIKEAEFLRPEQVDSIMKAATILHMAHQDGLRRVAAKSRGIADFAGVPQELLDLETPTTAETLGMKPEEFINRLQKNIDDALGRDGTQSGRGQSGKKALRQQKETDNYRTRAVRWIQSKERQTGKKFSSEQRKQAFELFKNKKD